jgi:peptidoglycan hydrolase-like protein with peptidoglycan-binding domain
MHSIFSDHTSELLAFVRQAKAATPDEIKAAQQHLKFMGYDIVQENGTVDPKTKSAVMQFQDSIGAPHAAAKFPRSMKGRLTGVPK